MTTLRRLLHPLTVAGPLLALSCNSGSGGFVIGGGGQGGAGGGGGAAIGGGAGAAGHGNLGGATPGGGGGAAPTGGGGAGGGGAASGGTGNSGGATPNGGAAGSAGASACGAITPQCERYCTAKLAAPSCDPYVAELGDCECGCEKELRADATCAVLFDEFVVCGGAALTLTCSGYDTPLIAGCDPARSEFASCLAAHPNVPTCTPSDANCVTFCNALVAPGCPTTMPLDTCTCWCQDTLSVACRDKVENLVSCTGGLPTFACDAAGYPALEGAACAAAWTAFDVDCY